MVQYLWKPFCPTGLSGTFYGVGCCLTSTYRISVSFQQLHSSIEKKKRTEEIPCELILKSDFSCTELQRVQYQPGYMNRWSCNKKLYQDFVKTNVGVYISFHSRAELSLSFWAQKYFLSPHIIFLGVESLLVIFCAIWVLRIDWAQ